MYDARMYEIERRFLCRIIDPRALEGAGRIHAIRQGYLTTDGPAVRIRDRGGEYFLTIKSGFGRVRREVEVPVDSGAGEALFEMTGNHRLEKLRYVLGPWEIDVFQGKLAGLVLAEIELDDEDAPLPPPPAGIALLHEVTDDAAYSNQRLAMLGAEEAERVVRKVRQVGGGGCAPPPVP